MHTPPFIFIYQKPMILTGTILTEGTATFAPVLTRLFDIAKEFIPYIMYIAIWALTVSLVWKAVKFALWYLAWRSKRAVRGK